MPKIIVTSRYIKANAHKKFGNNIKYIATCEGEISRTIKLRTPMKIRLSPKIKEC